MSRTLHLLLVLGVIVTTGSAAAAPKKGPKKPDPAPPPVDESAVFDRTAASSAITAADLTKCRATNAARGEGHVTVTFAPGGNASAATVDKGPWLGTPVAKCLAKEFKKAKVPAFKGDPVTVGKTFKFE
jgi:hypothetical protein